MMSSHIQRQNKHVTILEDYNQALAYVAMARNTIQDRQNETIIALTPSAQSLLKNNGVSFTNSVKYLNESGRHSALGKSSILDSWLTEHFEFIDEFGVQKAYIENLRWYLRWVIHYLLWSTEVITQIVETHKPEQLTILETTISDQREPFITGKEGYFANIAEHIASNYDITIKKLSVPNRRQIRSQTCTFIKKLGRKIAANPITHSINIRAAEHVWRSKSARPVLFTSDQYRLDGLAERMIIDNDITPVLMSDWGDYRAIGWPFRIRNRYPFKSRICINFMSANSGNHRTSKTQLEEKLVRLSNLILSETELFYYKNVSLSAMTSAKLIQGIKSDLIRLHKLSPILELVLRTMQPTLVVSNGCRLDDMITGELCRKNNIPSLMVSHGSHAPPSNKESAYEWQSHARKLINAPYDKTALQSRAAEQFCDIFPEGGEGVRTGPLIWTKAKSGRKLTQDLRSKLTGSEQSCRVVVHAGTPKARNILRFQVYETSDEYIQSIKDLSKAIGKLANTKLIVMFRPSAEITFKDLVNLVPPNEHTILTDSAPLDVVLGFTDLLVSYSSTVIEEALANNVPVLQYGGEGRYKHINVDSMSDHENREIIMRPIYHIKNGTDLEKYLGTILDKQEKTPTVKSTFNPYVFREDEICSISELLP